MYVTFGDGERRRNMGIAKLIYPEFHCLKNVPLVEGLNSNLISISQLCDEGMNVSFYNDECILSNIDHEILMNGSKSKDKCYVWIPQQ